MQASQQPAMAEPHSSVPGATGLRGSSAVGSGSARQFPGAPASSNTNQVLKEAQVSRLLGCLLTSCQVRDGVGERLPSKSLVNQSGMRGALWLIVDRIRV